MGAGGWDESGANKAFVEQVCEDLENRDRRCFLDIRKDSLPVGEDSPNLIFQAIDECQVGAVFPSEEFFSRSKWPMLELARMVRRLDHGKTPEDQAGFKIMPIFLPGFSFEDSRNEENRRRWSLKWGEWAERDESINLKEWERAFEFLLPISALFCKDGISEVQYRKLIVKEICDSVRAELKSYDSHVQGRSRIAKILLEKIDAAHVSSGIRRVGLYGMGGIGKTTLAKVLCNELDREFNGKVCHVGFEERTELEMLREMLTRLTDTPQEYVGRLNTDECHDKLDRALKAHKVFLAIDNVVDSMQVRDRTMALLRTRFAEDSVVLVISRSRDTLQSVNIHENDCIEMPSLDENEAGSLFLYHGQPSGIVDEKLMRGCLQRCSFPKGEGVYQYHPLAIKVFGLQLGNDVERWREKLQMLDTFDELHKKDDPIISFMRKELDLLKDEDKPLFREAALFCPDQLESERYVSLMKPGDLVIQNLMLVNMVKVVNMVNGRYGGADKENLEPVQLKGMTNTLESERFGRRCSWIGMQDIWREFFVLETKVGRQESMSWQVQPQGPSGKFPAVNVPQRRLRREPPSFSSLLKTIRTLRGIFKTRRG